MPVRISGLPEQVRRLLQLYACMVKEDTVEKMLKLYRRKTGI